MVQEGMLLQVDGSHHRWLGEEGPRFALLLAVDDATDTVPHALFSWQEDTRSYFRLMEELVRRRGIPLAIYSDRHGVFKFAGDVRGQQVWPTHFARAMEELGIRQIFARSPQAKGRVGESRGYLSGPVGAGTATGGSQHYRPGQPGAKGVPAPLQREVRSTCRAA